MVAVVLAIKPEFVKKILSGDKRFEFRKVCPRKAVDEIIIYETRPMKKVVGAARVVRIISMGPDEMWEFVKNNAGVSYEFFKSYFASCDVAYAYCLGDVVRYDAPKTLAEIGLKSPPQGLVYLDS